MMRTVRALLAISLAAVSVVLTAPHAAAGCHAFEIDVEPGTVNEGDEVTVTVTRDGNVGPSRVHVRTVNRSARAPQDFEALEKRPVPFTTETSKSFTLQTRNDPATEGDETFELQLFDGDGCPANPNFQYGPNAIVTITGNDPTPPPATVAPAAPAAPTAPPAATTAPTPAPTVVPSVEPSPSPEPGEPLSGTAIALIVLGVGALLALIAGIAFSQVRRRRSGVGPDGPDGPIGPGTEPLP